MTAKLNFKILGLCSVLSLSACGLDFSAGGVSVEGTGDPIIDIGPAGDAWGKLIYGTRYLDYAAIVHDQCQGVARRLSFIHPFDRLVLQERTQLEIPIADAKLNSLNLRLELQNRNSVPVEIHMQCDVPLALYLRDSRIATYPKHCDVAQVLTLEPQQSHVFEVGVNLTTIEYGKWIYGLGNYMSFNGVRTDECEALEIQFRQTARP